MGYVVLLLTSRKRDPKTRRRARWRLVVDEDRAHDVAEAWYRRGVHVAAVPWRSPSSWFCEGARTPR